MDTPEALARKVADEVRAAMKSAGMSQRDVAEETGIALVTLNRRLGGGKSFEVRELAAISAALNLSLTELMLRAERSVSDAA